MKTTPLTLLALTQHSTPSGNYNGTDLSFSGVAQKGPSYYSSNKSSATVAIFLNSFAGTLEIQGTLDSDPLTATWVTLESIIAETEPTTINTAIDVTGNLVWIRVNVLNFINGTITNATVAY